jgi:regulator of sirC expression with transglutaminase-like and TPR domain
MCSEANCQHVKFDPNKPASLTVEDQAAIWADIKATRKALEARQSFLEGLGADQATRMADKQFTKLSGLLAGLWARFRVL